MIRAELKNARIAREDQSTEESAMKPLIVSGSNFIAYGNSAPGRLKVRTKSRLKDDRAPRCSRERLPKGAIKQPRQKRHQLKSARGGTGGTDSNSPKGYTGKGFPGVSPRKSPLNPGELQTPGSIATQTSFHTESKNETEVKVETKGPAKVAAESTYVKDIPLKDAPAPNKVLNDAPIPPDLSVKCTTVKNLAAKVAPVQQLEPKGPVTDISLTKDVPSTTPPARAGAAKDPGPKCASSEPGATKPDPKSKTSVVASKNSNTHQIFLCRKCGKAKDRSKKSSKQKERNELINRKVEQIKANMKRVEQLSKPIVYCESSSSFSISSRIELSE